MAISEGNNCRTIDRRSHGQTLHLKPAKTITFQQSTKELPPKQSYSIEEHVQVIHQLLSNLLQKLEYQRALERNIQGSDHHADTSHLRRKYEPQVTQHAAVVNEVTEIVDLDSSVAMLGGEGSERSVFSNAVDEDDMPPLSKAVQDQLGLFVSQIASMYHTKNPFHCFEHASHVTCSAYQLVRRVVAKDLPKSPVESSVMADPWAQLPPSNNSCSVATGIARDALAQFAIVFSALIHDVDHPGVQNGILAKEKPAVAAKYQNRSLAEQTSVNLAWDLLSQESFHDLQACIFPCRKDYIRFRKMVINIVMSTDIADATLREFRELKWEKAFGSNKRSMHQTMEDRVEHSKEVRNRKATVMMDLIMMASDISHTMQPFDVYREWNERLFREMSVAYREGRSETDPSDGWYRGEMFFYDKHIIPLAQRLQESGMFGAAADAMLNNALNNRNTWCERGQQILREMQLRLDDEPMDNPTSEVKAPQVPTTTHNSWSTFISICCVGSLPAYLRANQNDPDDEDYYEDDEGKAISPSGEEETLGESSDEEEGFKSTSADVSHVQPSGWTSFSLRARAKQS